MNRCVTGNKDSVQAACRLACEHRGHRVSGLSYARFTDYLNRLPSGGTHEQAQNTFNAMLASNWPVSGVLVERKKDEDAPLLQRIANGDRAAFEQLFRRYHPRIYRYVYRMTRDEMLADEVSCDSLFVVWESALKFKAKSTVSTWIFGIAHRQALKALRKNARHTDRRDEATELGDLKDTSPAINPEVRAGEQSDTEQIMDAVQTLSDDHRAVVYFTATGHSTREIAEIVGCPQNTVKTRMFHARKQLRAILQKRGVAITADAGFGGL